MPHTNQIPPAAPRPRRRDATQNRDAILAAAVTILNRDSTASLEEIASEAGLTRRAVYGHFANRDALVLELLTRGAARLTGIVTTAISEADLGDSRIAIARIGERLWSEVDDVRVMARFAVRGPYLDLVAEALAPIRLLLRGAVERGIRSREIRQDLDAARLARLIEGAALAVLDEANRFPLSGEDGARMVMHAGLGMAGLSWAEAQRVIDAMEHGALERDALRRDGDALARPRGAR